MTISAIANYIEDSWDDNNLTGRSNPSDGNFEHPNDLDHAGDILKGVFRPDWNTVSGSPAAQNENLFLPDAVAAGTDQGISTPSVYMIGTFENDWTYSAGFANGSFEMAYIAPNVNPGIQHTTGYIVFPFSGGGYDLRKESGGLTTIIDSTWTVDDSQHKTKLTRDPFANFELFFDGASQGTGTDTEFTDSKAMTLSSNADVDVTADNLFYR